MEKTTLKSLKKKEFEYTVIGILILLPVMWILGCAVLVLLNLNDYSSTERWFALLAAIFSGSIGYFSMRFFISLKRKVANDYQNLYDQKLDEAKEVNKPQS